jgi:hypothetical protein
MPHARPSGTGLLLPTGDAFRTEWIDFDRGIRVGNLEPHERITQILKFNLSQRHQQLFTVDRWGRGEFWQWICWVPRANRDAKPLSSHVNFGCAKFYITVDRDDRVFESGIQIERAPIRATGNYPGETLQTDWDWHVLVRNLRRGGPLERELRRLVCEDDFVIRAGSFEEMATFDAARFRDAVPIRKACEAFDESKWGGLQVLYPMPEKELQATSGPELVEAVLAVFDELVPAMNLCLGLPCLKESPAGARARLRAGLPA